MEKSRIAKTTLRKIKDMKDSTVLDFETYKNTVIKMQWYWHEDR